MSALVTGFPVPIALTQLPNEIGSVGTPVMAAAKVGSSVGNTACSMCVNPSSHSVTPAEEPGAMASTRLHRASRVVVNVMTVKSPRRQPAQQHRLGNLSGQAELSLTRERMARCD